jgi:hypothetical protein
MAFTPFMQGTEAQSVISDYLGGKLNATPNVNSAGMWRNPNFDLRTEQEKAGTLDKTALYPNPQIDFSAQDDPVDPCREGFMLVDGVCQPIETFGQSAYDEQRNDDPDDPPREYYSIDEMKEMGDAELLDYLNDGWLKGDPYDISVGGQFGMPPAFQFMFGGQNEMRRDFIINELAKRGYNIDTDKGQLGLGQSLSILNNANLANKYVNEDPRSTAFFTPEEINYQIQAKQDAQNIVNQGGNPYGQSYTGTPKDIHNQVVQDAIQSGGTVNPWEAQNINAGGTNNTSTYTGKNPFKDEDVWI